ncbi:MAG: DUF3159 domain-containing protein [Ancrocorticia sp.]|uniref:DUF3159 domain-containing protein n=1 Tax=Ancrocorticia sp. TaxID=2593684 RepID=UPI003F916473
MSNEPKKSGLNAVVADEFDVWQALGGVRGLIETAAPSLVFITVFVISGELLPAIAAPVIFSVGCLLLRLLQRIDVMPALSGLAGIAISAIWAWRSGEASNFFIVGLLTNSAYLAVLLLSLAARWPALGLLIGFLRGDTAGWRKDPEYASTKRAYQKITWLWCGLFAGRLIVQAPLFFADATAALGVARMVMGPFLFAFVAWISWLMVRPLPEIPGAIPAEDAPSE